MATHFERSFEKDLERIRERLLRMGALGETALRKALKALQERNRQLAYNVILGDRKVDEMEREVDQLCLEFLVRQQPVAAPLRFAYATIRINLELERIGDYAESIARQALKVMSLDTEIPLARFSEIANLSIPMLHDALQAFVQQDASFARRIMQIEEMVDILRTTINAELYEARQQNRIPLEALTPLMTIARRFERVSDQAKNICQEVIYCATGEYTRHQDEQIFRILFVDEHDACRAPMAAAIGHSLEKHDVLFASAGLSPSAVDRVCSAFLKEKGLDISKHLPAGLPQPAALEQFHVIVGLAAGVQTLLPPPPRKTVFLDWSVPHPAAATGSDREQRAFYEKTYLEIKAHIHDLVDAISGTE